MYQKIQGRYTQRNFCLISKVLRLPLSQNISTPWKCCLCGSKVRFSERVYLHKYILFTLQKYLLQAAQDIQDKEENFKVKPSSTVWEFRENPAADWLKKESPNTQ